MSDKNLLWIRGNPKTRGLIINIIVDQYNEVQTIPQWLLGEKSVSMTVEFNLFDKYVKQKSFSKEIMVTGSAASRKGQLRLHISNLAREAVQRFENSIR